MPIKKLSEVQLIEFLKRYPNEKTADLALEFELSVTHATKIATSRGIYKSPQYMAKINKNCGLKTRFKKGQIPHNKGKKESEYIAPEQIEKMKATRFKKGSIPKNAKPDWYEGIYKEKGIPYYRIKIPGERKLKRKHLYLWEQAYGKIPKGHNIVFKDRNTLNCVLENLECISNQENMLRNSKTATYPKELIPTYAKIAELNKLIKTKENGKD